MSKNIKKNIIAKTLLSILNIAVPILIGPYVVRVLDINLYTELTKSISLLAWFLPFAIFGVNTYGLREISRFKNDKQQVNTIISEFLLINIFTSIIIFFLYLFLINTKNTYFYIYLITSFQILFSFLNVEYINEAFESYGFILYKNLILRLIYIIFIFLFVKNSTDIIYYTLICTSYAILNNIISFMYIKLFISLVRINYKHIIITLRNLLFMLILTNSSMLYTTLDRFFLSFFTKTYDITYYSMTQNILTGLLGVFLSIIFATIPRLSYYYSNNFHKEYNKLLLNSSSLFYLLIIPSCIGICLLGNQIMTLYGSVKYIQAGPVLSIFAIRFILNAVDNVFSKQILIVTGNEYLLTKIFFLGGFINLTGNLLLLFFNILSAFSIIITTMIAEIVVLFVEQYYIKKIKINNTAMNKQLIKYILIALFLFYFIIKIIFSNYKFPEIISGQIIYLGLIIGVCIIFYLITLLLIRDRMLTMIFLNLKNTFLNKIR